MSDQRILNTPGPLGIVVIGRNEGDRLQSCLDSLDRAAATIVYVDSGSMDGSVARARRQGITVIELDMTTPFSAARARNAGYQHLVRSDPQPVFVQFIDADCQLTGDWLTHAARVLAEQPALAIVAGWLHERHPEASIYNRLGDLEWNFSGAGEVSAVGGIFMVRCEAFDSVGGFDPTVAAGEEPELCLRLIRKGWRLLRLDRDMATHDLAMKRFGQWWRRMVRSGYGGMDVARRFGIPEFTQDNRRARAWTAWLLLVIAGGALLAAAPGSGMLALAVPAIVAAWPAQWLRIALRTWRSGQPLTTACAYAYFTMIAFLPQIVGQLTYFSDRLQNRSFRLVEYKSTPPSSEK